MHKQHPQTAYRKYAVLIGTIFENCDNCCITLFFKEKVKHHIMNTNDIWLIAGLGNPEAKYDGTRHNAGFAALDYLAGKWGISVSKTKFQGLWGQGEVDGRKVVLLKPLTYMNLSGDSIAPLAGFFKIPADHVIVLCDDITQAPASCASGPPARQAATTA